MSTGAGSDFLFGQRRGRATLLALALLCVAGSQAQAQTALPEVSVPPPSALPKGSNPNSGNGTGIGSGSNNKLGDQKSLEQINRDLKRKVDETNPVLNTPPLDAASPDPKTGVVNIPGVQQQYGKNFGNSVVPFRPPPPVYTSPVGRR